MSRASCALAWLGAMLIAGCGGTGGGGHAGAMSCSPDPAYIGPALHASLPAGAFPSGPTASMPSLAEHTSVPEELSALLNARVDDLLEQTGAPAIHAGIDVPGLGRWSATRGWARVVPAQPATDATLFYWASVAKSLTAVLVLQLVEEGRLRLDDRLAAWYPQLPNADLITIGQLLTHTSGLATNPSYAVAPATSDEWLAAAMATPAVACPGSVASYSNIGYELLGRIVQEVEKQSFDAVLQRRIAEPLGLRQLRALHAGEDEVAALATPHLGRVPTRDAGAWLRIGAGNVIASARDMLSVWRAVLEGRLLRSDTVARQWAVLYPIADRGGPASQTAQTWFGQGVMLMEWTDASDAARSWLGHLGGVSGANAVVAYDASADAYVAVAMNSDTSAAAVGNALLEVLVRWRVPGAR